MKNKIDIYYILIKNYIKQYYYFKQNKFYEKIY